MGGFLERFEEKRQQGARMALTEEGARRMHVRLELADAVRREAEAAHLKERSKQAFFDDCRAIAAMVGRLPECDFGEYFDKVIEFTGYDSYKVILYMRHVVLDQTGEEREEIAKAMAELDDRLEKRGLKEKDQRLGIMTPNYMFFMDKGVEITVPASFLKIPYSKNIPASEPHGPGIGVRFEKLVKRTLEGSQPEMDGQLTGFYACQYNVMYVRFGSPDRATITGATQLQANTRYFPLFDEVLERAFNTPGVYSRTEGL